jgi:hypothetical protein
MLVMFLDIWFIFIKVNRNKSYIDDDTAWYSHITLRWWAWFIREVPSLVLYSPRVYSVSFAAINKHTMGACRLGYITLYSVENKLTFRGNVLSFSELISKPSKKPAFRLPTRHYIPVTLHKNRCENLKSINPRRTAWGRFRQLALAHVM